MTLFEENNLHIALLTETWLSQKHCSARTMADLMHGANISFIRRDRGSRGGGVAICYDPTKIRMSSFSCGVNASKSEVVCAVGNSPLTRRKIAAISAYLPPNLDANNVQAAILVITSTIDKLKSKYTDPIIIVGGDFNRKDLSTFSSMFPELKPVLAGATRGGASLDEIFTNVSESLE